MKLKYLLALALVLPTASFAEQATPQETMQALQSKLQDEVGQDLQVRALLVRTQNDLAAARKELSDLKAKKEPK